MSVVSPLAAWLCLALPLQDVGAAAREGQHAFLELAAARATCYEHEVLELELRFGFERGFLEQRLIQPFRRRLDVPVQLHASWLEGLACAQPQPAATPLQSGATLVLEDEIVRARRLPDEVRDGRNFAVFALERCFHTTCPGTLTFSAPYLRFAYADRFQQDVFGERVPVDRHDEVLAGTSLAIQVLPLPEPGRPPDFSGAVGRFSVRAEAAPSSLAVGESLKLTLTIEGEGDLDHFDPPRLGPLEGLRVRGWVEEDAPQARRIVYDLVVLSEHVQAVPAIPFWFFDPEPPASYRSVRTEPLALTLSAATPLPPPSAADAPLAQGTTRRSPLILWGGTVAAALLLAGALLGATRRRRRSDRAPSPDPAGTRATIERLRERAQTPGADVAQALAEHLAGRLGCPVPAVIGPGLRTRLGAAGVPAETAARTTALLEALIAARYGGNAPGAALEQACALVEELELSLGRRTPPP